MNGFVKLHVKCIEFKKCLYLYINLYTYIKNSILYIELMNNNVLYIRCLCSI